MTSKILAVLAILVSFVYCVKKPVKAKTMSGEKSIVAMSESQPCHG